MDTNFIEFQNIYNKDPFCVSTSLNGTAAAEVGNFGIFFTALRACEVSNAAVVYQTASGTANSLLNLEKLTGVQGLDGGVTVFSSTVNLNSSANTVIYPSLTLTTANKRLERGDRLALSDSGNMNNLAGLNVVVQLKPIGKGHYN